MKNIITWLKDNKFLFIILVSTILIIAGMLFINEIIISIRLMELRAFIRDIDIRTVKSGQLGMIGKFRLYKGLYENRIREDELQKKEMEIMYLDLVSGSKERANLPLASNRLLAGPVMAVINAVRFVIGKQPLSYQSVKPELPKLSYAYYLERIKQYGRAAEQYDEIISNNEAESNEIYTLMLHQGFCLSLAGDKEKARTKYLEIIQNYRNEDIAITAAVLLRYLDEFEAEAKRVYASGISPLVKSEQLYKLVAFDEALAILKQLEKADKTEKVQYLEARCYEETGKQESAVRIYQQIIDTAVEKNNFSDDIAKLANRRILTIAVTADAREKMTQLASQNHQIIRDPEFGKLLTIAEKTDIPVAEKVPETGKEEGSARDTVSAGEDFGSLESSDENGADENGTDVTATDDAAEFSLFIDSSIENIEKKMTEKGITPIPFEETADTLIPEPTGLPADNSSAEPTAADDTARAVTGSEAASTEVPAAENIQEKNRKEPYQKTYRNNSGNITKIEFFNADNVIISAKEYDDAGHVIKVLQYENGRLKVYFVYELDDKGNPVKVFAYDANGRMLEDKKD